MDSTSLIGASAALCSISSFMPQAWRIVKTRDVAAISAPMYALTVIGFGLWIGYGFLIAAWPIIIPNSVCLVLSAFILIMKLLPGSKRDVLVRTIKGV